MKTRLRSSPRLTVAVLTLGCGSFTLLQSLLNPVLPVIRDDFGASTSAVSWVLIAWLLSAAVATPILGRVGDMIGKTRTLQLGLFAIAAGGAVAAVSPTLWGVILGRVIQGLGGAVMPLSFGILRDALPREKVPGAVGILSSVIAVGGGLGGILAGPIVEIAGWRGLFWMPALVVLATMALGRAAIPPSDAGMGGRINWGAAAALGGWLIALLLALTEGPAWGWSSPAILGLWAAAAALALLWLVIEIRTDAPLIDLRLMRLRAVWTTNVASTLIGGAMFAVWVFVPQMLQIPVDSGWGFGLSVTAAGWTLAPMLTAMAITGAISGRLLPFVSLRTQLVWGSAGIAAACLGLALAHGSIAVIVAETTLFGAALGIAYATMTSLVVQAVPAAQTGVATGMAANLRIIGGAIGTAVMTAMVAGGHDAGSAPSEAGYVAGYLLFAAVAAASALLALRVPVPRASVLAA